MAEDSSFDVSSLRKELTSIQESLTSAIGKVPSVTVKQEAKTLKIKALSWNIKENRGTAFVRNFLVPQTVSDINPDVVFLQEQETEKIIKYIASVCSLMWGRSYERVSGRIAKGEAAVLYDSNVFHKFEDRNLSHYMGKVFKPQGPQTRKGKKIPQVEVFEDRVAAVSLEHNVTGEQIIFISFHKKSGSDQLATNLLEIVSTIGKEEKALVVTGADFIPSDSQSSKAKVCVPRKEPEQMRFPEHCCFIFAGPRVVKCIEVFVQNIIPDRDSGSDKAYSNKKYNESVKHDPLVCQLSIM